MHDPSKAIIVLGTMDTKGPELAYLAQQIEAAGMRSLLMDVGVHTASDIPANISAAQVAAVIDEDIEAIRFLPRGEAVEKMVSAASKTLSRLIESGDAHGVIGVGGSGGTTICAAAMRALPYGVPKFMVSTLASGNTRWHVDIADIVMIPSLLDIGGLNPMLEMVLNNAARGIVGMVAGYQPYQASGKKVISMTMYGTTTPGVSRARQVVDDAGFETWVFHASGVGGRTMEVGAHLVGGLHDAGPKRLEMAGSLGLPQVIVPGAADTIVLPPRDQVPEKFANRILNFHNPTMTTMRTTVEENVAIGEFIAAKLNRAKGPVVVMLPLGGVSTIDRPDKIFYDPAANSALFDTLKRKLSANIEVVEDDHHIDDPQFARRVGEKMVSLLEASGSFQSSPSPPGE
jgi:uncharacterized protein (UPF0261 family)